MVVQGMARAAPPIEKTLQILDVKGGLVVHLGCGDGALTAALRASDVYLVHGLDADPANVTKARAFIRGKGLYGPVSVDRLDGPRLPYTDNLVRLLVADDLGGVPMTEVMRVLAPNGVAYVGGKKTVKPWPDTIDEWTHYLHDATNNAVAHDSVVGPPKGLQWSAGPLYCRSHEFDSSVSALVSAGGRIFYILDDGPTGVVDKRLPQTWSLYARDAFSGVFLWKVPVPDWGWTEWKRADLAKADWTTRTSERLRSPVSLTRRLVADAERVYVTLGYDAGVSILDAATGAVIRRCAGTENTDEILYSDGVLLAVVRKDRPGMGKAKEGGKPGVGNEAEQVAGTDRLMALDAATGQRLWQTPSNAISQHCVAIEDGRVFFHSLDHLVCLDLRTGKERWRTSSQSIYGPLFNTSETMVAFGGRVFFSGRELEAFSAETGERLWSTKALKGPGRYTPPDLFVASGCVWAGHASDAFVEGLDPQTGAVKQTVDLQKLINPWHHYRCYRSKATDRYLIWPKQGAEFIDLQGNNNMRHDWLRGPCRYGLMPCNGMLYAGPHQCICFSGVLLNGFNALTPRSAAQAAAPAEQPRLEKGPAFGAAVQAEGKGGADWPMFRANPARSGRVRTTVRLALSPVWQTKLQGKLSQPVAAGGRLYVCETETDRILCLDGKDGHLLWSATVGGRVDSPPTIYEGLAIFGSADGWVYCLRASDGVLAWRYRVAPAQRRVVSMGRVESVWPVHGAVLVQNGVVYAAAGRSTFLDGGIFLCSLDPATGKLLHEAQLEGPWPDVAVDDGAGRSMPGARVDVLVGDGANVYMRQVMFDAELRQQGSWGGQRLGSGAPNPHLVATSDLLDDAGFNRTCWRYSDGKNLGQGGAQMLVFDAETTYSAQIYSKRVGRSMAYFPGEGYVRLAALPHGQGTRSRKRRKGAADDGAGWNKTVPIFVRAMALAGNTLLVSGMPDRVDPKDPPAALEGRAGGVLWAVSALDGRTLAECRLDAPPVFDGLIAADGRLYLSLTDGRVVCLGGT
jgi:outer membrane protein assembly factor BamB